MPEKAKPYLRNGKAFTGAWLDISIREALDQAARRNCRTVSQHLAFYAIEGLRSEGLLRPPGDEEVENVTLM